MKKYLIVFDNTYSDVEVEGVTYIDNSHIVEMPDNAPIENISKFLTKLSNNGYIDPLDDLNGIQFDVYPLPTAKTVEFIVPDPTVKVIEG